MDLEQIGEMMNQPAGSAEAQKKPYVHTTFIPNESQQFVPQKKMNFAVSYSYLSLSDFQILIYSIAGPAKQRSKQ